MSLKDTQQDLIDEVKDLIGEYKSRPESEDKVNQLKAIYNYLVSIDLTDEDKAYDELLEANRDLNGWRIADIIVTRK